MTMLLTALCVALAGLLAFYWRDVQQAHAARARCARLQIELGDALAILHALPAAVVSTDHQGVVRYLNPSAERLTGASSAEGAGKYITDLLTLHRNGAAIDVRQQIRDCLRRHAAVASSGEAALGRLDGTRVAIEHSCAPVALASASAAQPGAVLLMHDVSARRGADARLELSAHHDGLTGLPNRPQFHLDLERGIAYARRHHSLLAVLLVDIDHFKAINDSLGHDIGDQVLAEFARRLLACARRVDTVARQHGDAFTILLSEIRAPQDAQLVAEKIAGAIAAPFVVGANSLSVAASVGIAVYPDDDGEGSDALIEKAGLAMCAARQHGAAGLRFAPAMQARSISRPMLETALRGALAHEEFILDYQPKVDLKRQRISGVKALLRWNSPQLGRLLPPDFMPVLEKSGLMVPVGTWVLARAVAQARHWIELGQPLTVSVSLSARQFYQDDIVSVCAAILQAGGVAGRFIELEIAESILIDRNQNCGAILRQFKQLGMAISIGDFGAGYASLNYLKRFPVDVVKLDKCFIDDLRRTPGDDDGAVAGAIIDLAHSLKMKVTAGGVETDAQMERLAAMECDEAFGFCLGGAVAPEQIDVLLKSGHVRAG